MGTCPTTQLGSFEITCNHEGIDSTGILVPLMANPSARKLCYLLLEALVDVPQTRKSEGTLGWVLSMFIAS